MNVSLPPELERLIDEKVASGLYDSASEVVRDALRLMRERDEVRALAIEELRKDILAGVQDMEQGRSAPLDVDRIKALGRKRMGI
jgi:antitoxin ParD1/3/4